MLKEFLQIVAAGALLAAFALWLAYETLEVL